MLHTDNTSKHKIKFLNEGALGGGGGISFARKYLYDPQGFWEDTANSALGGQCLAMCL